MADPVVDIHRRSAEAARHVEYTPYVHPEIDRAQFRRVERRRLNPFPREFRQTPYGEQNENGTDLSLVRSMMRLPTTERIRIADDMTARALRTLRDAQQRRQNPKPR